MAVVTGGGSGVGAAAALLVRDEGARVLVSHRLITSSIDGTTTLSDIGSTTCSSSKAAEIALMRTLALELAEHRIRVNAICPGSIDTAVREHTEMRDTEATNDVADYRRDGIPLTNGRMGRPEQVAELALFLASRRASHITGASVSIDGGQSLVQA